MKTANYGSHVVRTEIDGWGRKRKLVDPSAGTYTYRYNSLGELLEETTPKEVLPIPMTLLVKSLLKK